MTSSRHLCVHCVYQLSIPATKVDAVRTAEAEDEPPDFRLTAPGARLIAAVRRARDDGYMIVINNQTDTGIYADMIFHGDSVCAAHLWVSVDQARKPRASQW